MDAAQQIVLSEIEMTRTTSFAFAVAAALTAVEDPLEFRAGKPIYPGAPHKYIIAPATSNTPSGIGWFLCRRYS